MSAIDAILAIVAISTGLSVAGTMFYWGGQVHASLKAHGVRLDDHEGRLREGGL